MILLLGVLAGNLAGAQEFNEYPSSNRDQNGKIIRSGYITNPWYDNWVISAGAGVSAVTAKGNTMMVSPNFELDLTKWATPSLAFRFGLQGYKGREHFTPNFRNHSTLPYDPSTNVVSWDYFYAHADMLWCITNTIFGYKFRRIYSLSPYIHGGYQRIFDPNAYKTNYDREMVFGGGLLNSFRLCDRLSLTIDLRASNFSGRFHDSAQGGRATELSASAGLALNIFKPGWRRAKELEDARDAARVAERAAQAGLDDAEKANRRLSDDNATLRDKNRALEDEINALKAVAASEAERKGDDELLSRISDAGLVIYYDKDVFQIRKGEELHIDDYVRRVLAEEPLHVFYLTGSADKGTGTFERNSFLSINRVHRVKTYMMSKFGIPESRIVIKAAIISDKHEDGRLDRCVLFEDR